MDYEKMKVAELRELLEAKGLSKSGKKSELIERLSDKPKELATDKRGRQMRPGQRPRR